MTAADLIEIFLLVLLGGVGAPLLVGRLNRLEDKIDGKADREQLHALGADLRNEMAQLRTEFRGEIAQQRVQLGGEIAQLRAEVRDEIAQLRVELRDEIRGVRSDLTQVALAVGIRQPRAGEG